jgi:hypothetical protein
MELPNDIWNIIVKQSKKSNDEFVADMNLIDLRMLEIVIAEKKTKMYNAIKSKIDNYDIIEVYDDNNKYEMDCIVVNKNTKKECCIDVIQLVNGSNKTIFGKYLYGNNYNIHLCLTKYNIKIKSKIQHRCRENINIANELKVGDVFCYSLYTCVEWIKMRNRIYEMEFFKDGIVYDVVCGITRDKIIIKKYYNNGNGIITKSKKYVNKNMVLNKVEYNDNAVEYIRYKKKLLFESIFEIDKINDNKIYFENVNKKNLIQIQKSLKIIK